MGTSGLTSIVDKAGCCRIRYIMRHISYNKGLSTALSLLRSTDTRLSPAFCASVFRLEAPTIDFKQLLSAKRILLPLIISFDTNRVPILVLVISLIDVVAMYLQYNFQSSILQFSTSHKVDPLWLEQ